MAALRRRRCDRLDGRHSAWHVCAGGDAAHRLRGGCAARRRSARATPRSSRRPRPGGGVLPDRRRGRPRQRELQDRAGARACWPRRARTSTRRSSSRTKDQLEAALGEYQLASEYDPSNRQAASKVAALDQTIRDRIEASRPRPAIEQMRERARAAAAEPLLNPASRDPLHLQLQQHQPARHPQLHSATPPASTSPTTAKCRDRRRRCSSTASRSSRRSTRS